MGKAKERKPLEDEVSEEDNPRLQLLTREEQLILIRRAQRGNREALDELITRNMGLVTHVALKYANRGLPLEDLKQEGAVGLYKGIRKFNTSSGNALSTYATWWIRQSITRALGNTGSTVRLPIHVHELINYMRNNYDSLREKLGRPPTPIDIRRQLKKVKSHKGISLDLIRHVMEDAPRYGRSLDQPVHADSDRTYGDVIASDAPDLVYQNFFRIVRRELFDGFDRRKLSDKQQKIIVMRYGLNGRGPMTLEQIGDKLDVTRERIRQLEARSLGKLSRDPPLRSLYERLKRGEYAPKLLLA